MREDRVLNRTLEMLEEEGIGKAYEYVVRNKQATKKPSSQYYNFLYCLAALEGKTDEAIAYLEEAIFENGYWYRPEVFEDDDLDSLRDNPSFKDCRSVSDQRYMKALEVAETVCTWEEKTEDNILLALHGNQQNISHIKEAWSPLDNHHLQIEYIQSKEIDSFGIFRWNDDGDGPLQLKKCLEEINWDSYKKKILGGFSAGCNVILRAIVEEDIDCSVIVLQSPWIPVIENELIPLVEMIKKKDIKVMILCGSRDQDCISFSKSLASALLNKGAVAKSVCINELGHEFPDDFKEIVEDFLEDLR